jgi:hypothetical protein
MASRKEPWQARLRSDPVPVLLSCGNPAIEALARQEFLGGEALTAGTMAGFPEVKQLLKGQQPDGSWTGAGGKPGIYPPHHYSLVETFRRFRLLVERYRLDCTFEQVSRAAEYLLSRQTEEGDIRGFIGNQYATYYTGAVMVLLNQSGLDGDARVVKALDWLLGLRQDDGGWTVPIQTHPFSREEIHTLTSGYAEPVPPDRTRPFAHTCTNMVLAGFATHPGYRGRPELQAAGRLVMGRFFQPDAYASYRDARYWVRFVGWWPNLLTALESLFRLGFTTEQAEIRRGIDWFIANQRDDGLWDLENDGKVRPENRRTAAERPWLALAIGKMLRDCLG